MLDLLYKSSLVELRKIAESEGIQKSGSVEVLRARIIKQRILSEIDLSWEGIQGTAHVELGEILKIFGIKSSGSHKERRRRLWLHLNFDSRRMTIERLVEMDKETLYELCRKLEMPVSGTRTVLMGRVAGVLTNQSKGWGRIKRSLHRNGVQIIDLNVEKEHAEELEENIEIEEIKEEFSKAYLEDAREMMIIDIDKESSIIQGHLLAIQARIPELERIVSTILREYGGEWKAFSRKHHPAYKHLLLCLYVSTNHMEVLKHYPSLKECQYIHNLNSFLDYNLDVLSQHTDPRQVPLQ